MNLGSAEKAIRNGAVAGFISAGITLVIVSIAVWGHPKGVFEFWNDPLNFLEVALVVGMSLTILRRSRAAAIGLFVYFILAKIFIFIEMDRPRSYGIGLVLVFLYFFGRAIQGTFAYHRIRREQDPEYRPVRRWMYFVWVPVGLVGVMLAGLILVGLTTTAMIGPSITVVTGDELRQGDLELLRAEGIVEPNEHIVLFYSGGFLSIREDGSLITDKRVISYEEIENQMWIGSAPFDEIEDVSIEESDGFLSDTVLLVTLVDGKRFRLFVSTEKDGDKRFLDELNKRMK